MRLGQGFDDRQALHVRADVHDREIDFVYGEADDFERLLRLVARWLRACSTVVTLSYEQDVSFHDPT